MAVTTRPPVNIIDKIRPIPARWARPDRQYREMVAGTRRAIATSRDLLERTKDFYRGD